MSSTPLLLLKLLLVPALIAAITLAGRRWGAAVAGSLAGFPVVTGPILFFLAVEQGVPFATQATIGAIAAVVTNISFGLVYSWVSRRHSWRISLVTGWVCYFALVALLNQFRFSLLGACLLSVIALIVIARLYPPLEESKPRSSPAGSDVGYRMVAGAALVLAVTVFSDRLGPGLSGLFSVFPVMASVLAVFSHRNLGQPFAVRLLRGMVRGFYSFTVFCAVLALTLPVAPMTISFIAALAAGLVAQGATLLMHKRAAGS
jgi:hypothetical protein